MGMAREGDDLWRQSLRPGRGRCGLGDLGLGGMPYGFPGEEPV